MSVSDPESWARLRLAQGESTIPTLELKGSLGQTTLTVGQSPGCDWIVRAPGVAPVHFSLHWDGRTLRIADVYGAGGVRADGEGVGAQWRVLSGRVRVDFGKAAIVVEAAAAAYLDTTADPTPLPPINPGPASNSPPATGSQRPGSKATLLGVAPVDPSGGAAARVHSSAPPAAADESPAAGESFRPRRPGDSGRPAKPTLLGLSSVPPGPQPNVDSGRPPAGDSPLSSATLLGFGPDAAPLGGKAAERAEPKAGGLASEQRTVLGFPALSSHPPPQGQVTAAVSNATASAVSRAPVQSVATPSGMRPRDPQSAPPSPEGPQAPEVGGPSSEAPRSAAPAASSRAPVPQAVLLGQEGAPPSGHTALPHEPHEDYDPDARYSDAPTRMRNPALLEPRRSSRRMPWRYLGVGVLTLAAYFAWLYLLDHL